MTTSSPARPAESLDRVVDPEIPVLTIRDLGILREVTEDPSGRVEVVITPTYSGCPAMDVIREDIVRSLSADGYDDVTVRTVMSPAWTTDWMTDEGRRKLDEYGIAPPAHRAGTGPVSVTIGVRRPTEVACPRCGSPGREVSSFGSTACKAHYVCSSCEEPFDYFKTI